MRLFSLLLLLGLGCAAEPPRTFAGGADVFGRLPPCRACHALLSNLDSTLLPRLRTQLHRDAVRRQGASPSSRRVDYGAYEGARRSVPAASPLARRSRPRPSSHPGGAASRLHV